MLQAQAADQSQVMERELRTAQRDVNTLQQEKEAWLRDQVHYLVCVYLYRCL